MFIRILCYISVLLRPHPTIYPSVSHSYFPRTPLSASSFIVAFCFSIRLYLSLECSAIAWRPCSYTRNTVTLAPHSICDVVSCLRIFLGCLYFASQYCHDFIDIICWSPVSVHTVYHRAVAPCIAYLSLTAVSYTLLDILSRSFGLTNAHLQDGVYLVKIQTGYLIFVIKLSIASSA